MSTRSVLSGGHVFKVRNVHGYSVQGQDCLEVMSSRSGLFRGHVFKVRIV